MDRCDKDAYHRCCLKVTRAGRRRLALMEEVDSCFALRISCSAQSPKTGSGGPSRHPNSSEMAEAAVPCCAIGWNPVIACQTFRYSIFLQPFSTKVRKG